MPVRAISGFAFNLRAFYFTARLAVGDQPVFTQYMRKEPFVAEQEDTGLLREIDEELRQDKLTAATKTYGKYVIAAAILLVTGVAGFKGWQSYDRNARMETTSAYIEATTLADRGDAAAIDSLATVAQTGAGDVKLLAELRRAQVLAENGDVDAAISIYRQVSSDTSIDKEYRSLAALYLATHLLNRGEVSEARSVAAKMTDAGNPYQFAALEVTALADLENGDPEAARGNLNVILDSDNAPQGVRSRAAILIRTLPGGVNGG